MRCGLCKLHTRTLTLKNKKRAECIVELYKHARIFKNTLGVRETPFIRALKPNLNVQSDSTRAKVFSKSSHPVMLILRAKIALNAVICLILYILLW